MTSVRTCVIFNPTAKGDKARKFRQHLDAFGSQCSLKLTTCAGDARRLAAEAVREGFKIVVAAGGDGTVNEVLNGMADVPGGCERSALGVLPLGTVNVFARELSIPTRLELAWAAIMRGREMRIDLPVVEYTKQNGQTQHRKNSTGVSSGSTGQGNGEEIRVSKQRRYFAQLAGAGLDARAIELVHWELKKKIGPLAYVIAGLKALRTPCSPITISGVGRTVAAELVLIGNGRLYGGHFELFPGADLNDGMLEVCAFPRANWFTLARCGPGLLISGRTPKSAVEAFQAPALTLTSAGRVPFEVDGELVGELPVTFSVQRGGLRVVVP